MICESCVSAKLATAGISGQSATPRSAFTAAPARNIPHECAGIALWAVDHLIPNSSLSIFLNVSIRRQLSPLVRVRASVARPILVAISTFGKMLFIRAKRQMPSTSTLLILVAHAESPSLVYCPSRTANPASRSKANAARMRAYVPGPVRRS